MRRPLLHSALMSGLNRHFPFVMAIAGCLWLLPMQQAVAASSVSLKVEVGGKVVYCEARLQTDSGQLVRVLREGTEVGVDWEVAVERLRRFWLNSEVAAIQVHHRVVPDLVSRSWQLLDLTTGIARRVSDIREAVRFLTRLEHFPVLDRSLLEADAPYVLRVQVDERQGAEDKSWFTMWWGFETTEAAVEFHLP